MPSLRRLLLPLLALLSSLAGGSEPRIGAVPNLQALARQAGYIFSGTVASVERELPANSGGLAVMRVTFRVDQPVRGVRAHQLLAVREWAGLWEAGDRYQVGERMLVFFYPPSKLGLTSPVAGSFGRFNIQSNGDLLLPAARRAALVGDPAWSDVMEAAPARTPLDSKERLSSSRLARAVRRAAEE